MKSSGPWMDRSTWLSAAKLTTARGLCSASSRARVWPSPMSACTKTDRKSTRLNSSHQIISYAVFCLKKKKKKQQHEEIAIRSAGKNRDCDAREICTEIV